MYIDSLTRLSRAIDAALEAIAIPAVFLLIALIVTLAAAELRDRVRRRRRRASRRINPAPYSEILTR